MSVINLYCDESCHLENDGQPAMVLGVLSCPDDRRKVVGRRIKALKAKHGISPSVEVKWGSVSPKKLQLYLDLVDLFFDSTELSFRAIVVPDKKQLNHAGFNQTHDEFYYKMWYQTLVPLLSRTRQFQIYLDKKDTRSEGRARKLCEVLCNSQLDFTGEIISRVQHVHSHEVPLFQLADLLIGAVSYVNRGLSTSDAKLEVIKRIRERSALTLKQTTLLREEKLNLLVWRPFGGSAI
ncbi:DUF3800 domain-containing protein [Cupriavidus sp. IK-TO18]|uniref:DUF3800 domain-containing protein n=1 Tax=Cupriavidus sp. IK-TO18 TaxID=2782182 RepID=UPI00189C1145|nr:DUF3800 domain-containing protein [Cupriavidus sp. IK-TO18]